MSIGEAVKLRIQELCRERGITLNKLATLCGMTQSTLNNIISRPHQCPTVATVKKICDGLEISIVSFFDCPLFANLEQEIK